MEATRYDITAYTASFRLPGLMGYQATSPVPPPSTIFGILSAAAGRDISPLELEWVAYSFSFSAKGVDLEKIIAFSPKGPYYEPKLGGINTVPIKREFLYEPHLVLYLPAGALESEMIRPRYPLCLGRSQDVAMLESVRHTRLKHVESAEVQGVLIPFPVEGSAPGSMILSLPTCMNNNIPRTPMNVRLFHAVVQRQTVCTANLYMEEQEEIAVPLLHREFLMQSGE
jgi:CRISPR-associated protein Cas5t